MGRAGVHCSGSACQSVPGKTRRLRINIWCLSAMLNCSFIDSFVLVYTRSVSTVASWIFGDVVRTILWTGREAPWTCLPEISNGYFFLHSKHFLALRNREQLLYCARKTGRLLFWPTNLLIKWGPRSALLRGLSLSAAVFWLLQSPTHVDAAVIVSVGMINDQKR